MELRHLRYFLAVVDAGGFRAASRPLRVAQPPISRAVRELEDEIGVPLLDRSRTHVAPTRAGVLFAKRARAILAALERARADAARVEVPRAVVRAGHVLPEYLRDARAVAALAAMRRRRKVDVEVTAMLPRHASDALRAQRVDVVFVYLPFERDGAALRVEPVLQDEVVAAVPAASPLARRASVTLAALHKETLVLFPRAAMPERFDEILGHFTRAGLRPRVRTVGPSLREALTKVGAGKGVSIVPRRASEAHRDLAITLCPIADVTTLWTLAAVTADGATPAARELVGALRRRENAR
jgi:LysR family transcriptional regulator, benzoate and cis,cis-muconate-responsive activator of ben and cat genes